MKKLSLDAPISMLATPSATHTELAQQAIAAIAAAGCDYGDVRFCRYRSQNLMARDRSLGRLSERASSGFGVRVLWQGAWGFAASPHRTPAEVARVVALAIDIAKGSHLTQQHPVRLAPVAPQRDTYSTPIDLDPFAVPIATKADLLLSLTEGLLAQPGSIKKAYAFLSCSREDKLFASTEGACIEQTFYRTHPGFGCTAVAEGDAQVRSYERSPLNRGYEWVDAADLLAQVERVAAEANEKVRAPEAPAREDATLILKPSNLYLTIHESVGHPTELDRVFGYEANFAGTSFATPDGLGSLKYGAPWINFKADRTQPGGRSTVGYDDEGVPAQEWYVVKAGILTDYLTDRETASRLGRATSNGCAFADSWASLPMVRIPNLGLEPGPAGGSHTATLAEAIADTKAGYLVDGVGSFSIDQQRRNFQFGGDAFWKIEGGRIVGMVKDLTYQSNTTEFWGNIDAIGPASERELQGTSICGKGEPMQVAQMTHACVPVRVRNIRIGRSTAAN